jgi:uncharacterized membrane protein YbhN (UPF0104 family)
MEKIKKRISFFLKLAISATILIYIYNKIDLVIFVDNIKHLSLPYIVILIITSLLKHVTQCLNWYHALTINPDYKPNLAEVLKSYFIGLALRFVLPGGHATYGKMYFVENSKKATFFSVLIEKFFQTWGNLFYASIAAIFYFSEISMLLRIVISSVIVFSPILLITIIYLIPRYRKHTNILRKITPKIILSQLVFIPLTMIQYWLILSSFADITFMKSAISTALILAANVIPITYSGLGLREYFAINVLSKYNITDTSAVTTALVIFIINTLIPAIFGALFIVIHKRKQR